MGERAAKLVRALLLACLGSCAAVTPANAYLAVNDVSFASATDGMIGGAVCTRSDERCTPVLARSRDGGRHFRVTRRLLGPRSAGAVGVGAAVHAVSPSLAYVESRYRAYRTFDGGQHLQRVALGGDVTSFAASATAAFAVTHPCARDERCAPRLWHSYDAGRTWWYVTLPDATPVGRYAFSLVAASAADVVLDYDLRTGPDAAAVHSALLVSHDGGHTWQQRRHPCALTSKGSHVSTLDGRELWMGCNETDGSGHGYRSLDGGRHWRPASLRSFTWNLQPVAPGEALAATMKQGLLTTRDGGGAWSQHRPAYDSQSQVTGNMAVVGPHVWLVTLGFRLQRSDDRGHSFRWLRSSGR